MNKGKIAVVTGAGGTLCSAMAIDLAAQGCKVVLVGRDMKKLEVTAENVCRFRRTCAILPKCPNCAARFFRPTDNATFS